MRAQQIAAVMEGDLAGEGGRAAAAITGAADAVRAWTAGKGGAFYAQGEACPCVCRLCRPDYSWMFRSRHTCPQFPCIGYFSFAKHI